LKNGKWNRKGHTYPELQLATIIRSEGKFLEDGWGHRRRTRRNSEMIENLARDFWSPDGCQKCEAGLRNEPYPDYSSGQGMNSQTVIDWNQHMYDAVGWLPEHVNYYRSSGAVPCSLTNYQQVRLACSSSSWTAYKVNILTMTINATTVQSCRDGNCQTRPY